MGHTHTESRTGAHTLIIQPTLPALHLCLFTQRCRSIPLPVRSKAPARSNHPLTLHQAKNRGAKPIKHATLPLLHGFMGERSVSRIYQLMFTFESSFPVWDTGLKVVSGHKVRSRGCVITSKQMYYSYRLEDKWLGNLFVELSWRDIGLLAFINEPRDWSALRACILLSYLERQFSFVCCSLALKQVLTAGLSGQQCINHMHPTEEDAETKGQELMGSAEYTKRVNVGLDRALKRDKASSLSAAQSKHFSIFLLNKKAWARIRRIR